MKKYWVIFRTTFDEYLVYRLSFVLWRLRVVLNLLIVYFLWSSIYLNQTSVFGYSKTKIITYVLLTNLVEGIVIAGRTQDLADVIINGDIINFLLKPFPFLNWILTREIVDKVINVFFAFFEVSLLIFFLKPHLFFQNNWQVYPVLILSLITGIVINFFLSLIISFVAFWTPESWASRFIFMISVSTLNGGIFPLDVLPKSIYQILILTPFPYLMFVPCKIYLSGLNWQTFQFLVIGGFWAVGLYFVARFVWRLGLRNFSFYGK